MTHPAGLPSALPGVTFPAATVSPVACADVSVFFAS